MYKRLLNTDSHFRMMKISSQILALATGLQLCFSMWVYYIKFLNYFFTSPIIQMEMKGLSSRDVVK